MDISTILGFNKLENILFSENSVTLKVALMIISLKGNTNLPSSLFVSLLLYFIFLFQRIYLIFNICEINPISKSELIVLSCASSIIITEYSDNKESFSNSFNNIPSVTNLISVFLDTFPVSYLI